jgi:Rrf2 family transcriptional regulator, iron-sulfur cluster assembly transcription factor
MKFELGHKGDYALRAALHLACHAAEGRQKSREIAASMGIPATYLPQILGSLIRRGLVSSIAGPHGGYSLARPAGEISLLEVVEAAEGPVRSSLCPIRGTDCDPDHACTVHRAWRAAQEALAGQLAAESLADVVDGTACRRDCTLATVAAHL